MEKNNVISFEEYLKRKMPTLDEKITLLVILESLKCITQEINTIFKFAMLYQDEGIHLFRKELFSDMQEKAPDKTYLQLIAYLLRVHGKNLSGISERITESIGELTPNEARIVDERQRELSRTYPQTHETILDKAIRDYKIATGITEPEPDDLESLLNDIFSNSNNIE